MATTPTRAAGGPLTFELWGRAPYEVESCEASGTIGFAFDHQGGIDAIASNRRRPFQRRGLTLAWIPAGCPVYSVSPVGGEYLVIRGFGRDAVEPTAMAERPLSDIVDPAAVRAASGLRRALLRGAADADLFCLAEPAEVLRSAVLARLHRGATRASAWLTPARRVALDRAIDAHLRGPITVPDLAGALGLSCGFLTVACREGLGMTPHRYIVERRLARARMALTRGQGSLADVATDCGFADQSHLTRAMTRAVGMTPAAYRRMMRG